MPADQSWRPTPQWCRENGYLTIAPLPNGEWLAVQRMLFTWGLFIIPNQYGWRTRYCYEKKKDAIAACMTWKGDGDPPGNWVVQKPEDRVNPKWAKE